MQNTIIWNEAKQVNKRHYQNRVKKIQEQTKSTLTNYKVKFVEKELKNWRELWQNLRINNDKSKTIYFTQKAMAEYFAEHYAALLAINFPKKKPSPINANELWKRWDFHLNIFGTNKYICKAEVLLDKLESDQSEILNEYSDLSAIPLIHKI